jgi:uncharacterized protein with GYD domain
MDVRVLSCPTAVTFVELRRCFGWGLILVKAAIANSPENAGQLVFDRRIAMATYIMLTRLSHQALQSPRSLESLSHEVMERIRSECPEVRWQASYVVLGPADYVDIFTAPDNAMATKVATIIRTFGHATTEIWAATEWEQFVELVRDLPPSIVASA